MDRNKIITVHQQNIGRGYLPDPFIHLRNARDREHFDQAVRLLNNINANTILDIGSYDGWLDFLLIDLGYKVTGVELIPDLCNAAERYAEINNLDYIINQGFFDELDFNEKYDVILCYETLEHMPLEICAEVVNKIDSLASKAVSISLPDQSHLVNKQHLWTPAQPLIEDMFKGKKDLKIDYITYHSIPSNWFISYNI